MDLMNDLLKKHWTPIARRHTAQSKRRAALPHWTPIARRHTAQSKRKALGSPFQRVTLSRQRHSLLRFHYCYRPSWFAGRVNATTTWIASHSNSIRNSSEVMRSPHVETHRAHTEKKAVEQWLSEQDAYTLHKPTRTRFKRYCVVVGGRNQYWQADLVSVESERRQ